MKRLLPILALLALLPGLAFAGHGNEGDPGLNLTPNSITAPVAEIDEAEVEETTTTTSEGEQRAKALVKLIMEILEALGKK